MSSKEDNKDDVVKETFTFKDLIDEFDSIEEDLNWREVFEVRNK